MPSDRMRFRKYGRAFQLRIDSHEDLAHLLDLSESHWMATSAPVDAFACDAVFLKLLDSDENGRVRCDEVRRAARWVLDVLADRSGVDEGADALRLDALRLECDDGARIHAAAKRILRNLRRPDDEIVSLGQVRDRKRIFSAADANGDGIIPPTAAKDEEIAAFVKDVIAAVGGEADAGGIPGVTEALLDRFLKEAEAFVSWSEKGAPADEESRKALMPLGPDTAAAVAALQAVGDKVDDYFRLCATVAYAPASAASLALNLKPENALEEYGAKLLGAPLAPLAAEGRLDLNGPLNPAWRTQLDALREKAIAPLLGKGASAIGEEQWRHVRGVLAAHAAWAAAKPDTNAALLGLDKLRIYLDPRYRKAVMRLIAADRAAAKEIEGMVLVEKLILYQRWILEFVNNFVNFSRLYDPDERALFETGTLIMDGRQFTLCVKVDDRAGHAKIAENSRLFVIYVELTQEAKTERREIAAAVTSGGKGNLYVGKHGIFMDRLNRLWDATVVRIIENPISLSQAVKAPFKRVGELIQGQIERLAGSSQKAMEQQVSAKAAAVSTSVQQSVQQPAAASAPQAAAPAGGGSSGVRDILIGGSIAFAAVGSSLAYITKTLKGLEDPGRTIAMVVAFLIVALMLPMILNAWVKLRQRDLGTLLEASGWAVNGRMRLTRIMNGVFTRRPKLPKKARKQRWDRLHRYSRAVKRPFVWSLRRADDARRDIWESM